MPFLGTRNIRKLILISIAIILCIHVVEVFPRPFSMLPRVVARYIKGQSHASTRTIEQTSGSSNIMAPSLEP